MNNCLTGSQLADSCTKVIQGWGRRAPRLPKLPDQTQPTRTLTQFIPPSTLSPSHTHRGADEIHRVASRCEERRLSFIAQMAHGIIEKPWPRVQMTPLVALGPWDWAGRV